ncbi:MAG: precorrin-8X methylmutase [Chloroflexota bacterium]
MTQNDYIKNPTTITEQSFATIRRELAEMGIHLQSPRAEIIERMIHSTADFDFATITHFSETAVSSAIAALQKGCPIVCDVNMIRVGVSQTRISQLGGSLHCFVADDAVRAKAAEIGNTRSAAGIHLAHERGLIEGGVIVIGNAPTALYALIELIEAGVKPALVVGVPVGFISAVESKADLLARVHDVPLITTNGRKGGSPIAVAIANALLRLACEATQTEAEP